MKQKLLHLRRKLLLACCAVPIVGSALAPFAGGADAPASQPATRPAPHPGTRPGPIIVAPPLPPTVAPTTQTTPQLEAAIEAAGKTPPAWWDSTALDIPDYVIVKPASMTEFGRGAGIFFFGDVLPNASTRAHLGAKLLQHIYNLNPDNAAVRQRSAEFMGRLYTDLLGDYPRGAYWARKGSAQMELTLVKCYTRLGYKAPAVEILNRMANPGPLAMKAWADLGDIDHALSLVDSASTRQPGATYLAAGDICRGAGKTEQAIAFYNKAADPNLTRNDQYTQRRAQARLEVVKMFDSLDLAKVPDGDHVADSLGYAGPVEVTVVVKNHKLSSLKITAQHEKRTYSSLTEIPARIISKQSVNGIDTISGATITSEAIINATAKALSLAQKN